MPLQAGDAPPPQITLNHCQVLPAQHGLVAFGRGLVGHGRHGSRAFWRVRFTWSASVVQGRGLHLVGVGAVGLGACRSLPPCRRTPVGGFSPADDDGHRLLDY